MRSARGPLLGAVPGAPEVEIVPDFVDAISYRPFGCSTGGSQDGMAAWITVPRWRRTSVRPAPTAASSSQRSPHLVNDSTWEGTADRLAAAHDRTVAGQAGQRVPLARVGGADPGGGQVSASSAAAACRTSGCAVGRPRPGAGQRPARAWTASGAPRASVGDPLEEDVIACQLLGQEPGRPLVSVLAARRARRAAAGPG